MRINSVVAASRLILITGPEPLIIEETLDAIRAQHADAERLRFGGGEKVDWALLEGINREIPMLASERLVEVRLDTTKLDKKSSKYLELIVDNPSPDCLFVLAVGALSKAEMKAAWYQAIVQKAEVRAHKKIEGNAFNQWVRNRFKKHAVEIDLEAEALFCHMLEGNMLAAAQQVDLLALTSGSGVITVTDVQKSVVESNQFNQFALNDAILAGNAERAMRIVRQMRSDNIKPVQINAILVRELTSAYDIARAASNTDRLAAVSKRLRLWPARQRQLMSLAKRVGRSGIDDCLCRAARIDAGIKGRVVEGSFNDWDELYQLVLRSCGQHIALHPKPVRV